MISSLLRRPGTNPLDMEATLTSPNGKSETCEIRDMPGHIYDIKFSPPEDGIHTISIKYNGIHITGRYTSSTACTEVDYCVESTLVHCIKSPTSYNMINYNVV